MRFVRIIQDSNSLLSVFNEAAEISEFENIFEEWSDVQVLNSFFEENQHDLGSYSVQDAVMRTLDDAEKLLDTFYEIIHNSNQILDTLFKPLSDAQYKLKENQRSKAYGVQRKSWLRVYAIRIEANKYIITGGAIKLTQTMQERQHTQEQLNRLNKVRDYLIENGFDDRSIEILEV